MKVVVAIPTRYEPDRVRRLVSVIIDEVDDVILLDNGHDPPIDVPGASVVDVRGIGIYPMWNVAWDLARPVADVLVLLNDDVRVLPGTIRRLADVLADETVGVAYPDWPVPLGYGLPTETRLRYTSGTVSRGGMTGFAFAFRTDLPVPRFDESYHWWYGDDIFERSVRRAGLRVARVVGLPCEHESDAEANGWARRPELGQLVVEDRVRWEQAIRVRAAFLVPRRRDGGHRDRLWDWCRARWRGLFPDVEIAEGHHDSGPFSRSLALNRAARVAGPDWDVGIVIDSDVFLRASSVRDAIETADLTGHVTWGHRRWRGLSETATTTVLQTNHDFGPEVDHDDMDVLVERTTPLSWSCCIAIPRPVWEDVGGFDQRFEGWGFEDMAWQSVVVGLYGHERIESDVFHLWHPRSEERIVSGLSGSTASREYVVNARLGRRYMVALRRDHGLHDRPGLPSTPEEAARDVANLKKDDAKLAGQARHHNLPDWSDWWPTLRELRDEAKAYNAAHATGTVSLIVHTGGERDRWPTRREYLLTSLDSLASRVSGPIVQRVIYDCWGDDEVRAELVELGTRFGYYVVGPEVRPDYTASRRLLWAYLAKRATGSHVFGTEDDFEFIRDVDLGPLTEVLDTYPYLTQVALLRDAFYASERDKGGILGWPVSTFEPRSLGDVEWIEHRNFWTANPSLFRRSLTSTSWPAGRSSERVFGDVLFRDQTARSAFLGTGEEYVRHIGTIRAGSGY